MPYVTCPTCSERGKIPPNLVGARIKCRKCGISFTVAAPAGAKAASASGASTPAASLGPSAVAEPLQGIEVEGLDASSWALPSETVAILKGEAVAEPATAPAPAASADSVTRPPAAPAFVAAEPGPGAAREYKILTPKDKIFDGKFDLARLEEALNYHARHGWTVKSMSTPHIKNFSGVVEEMIVVLLER